MIYKEYLRIFIRLGASLTAITALILTGCGGGGGGGPAAGGPTITGFATMGPMNGAAVAAYQIEADGSMGAVLGTATTEADNSGRFSITLTRPPIGAVAIRVTNGSYISEFDGRIVNNTTEMIAILPSIPSGGANVSVTPLSNMAAVRAAALINAGQSIGSALAQADQEIQDAFGLRNKPVNIVPSFDSASLSDNYESFFLGQILTALEIFVQQTAPTNPGVIYDSLSVDISDGIFDGANGGAVVRYDTLGNVEASTLKAMMYIAMQTALISQFNGVSPKSLQSWVAVNPSQASSNGITLIVPGYHCGSGQLINDSNGRPTCWDGTLATDGSPIVGQYYVCAANSAKVKDQAQCPNSSSYYSCGNGYQLVTNNAGHPTCWDGTMATDGTPYLGTYYVCPANNAKVANRSQCPPSIFIPASHSSTAIAALHAAQLNVSMNSTAPATYTLLEITQIQQAKISGPLSNLVVLAINGSTDATLPSYITPQSSNNLGLFVDYYSIMNFNTGHPMSVFSMSTFIYNNPYL